MTVLEANRIRPWSARHSDDNNRFTDFTTDLDDFDQARAEAGLMWDVETGPVRDHFGKVIPGKLNHYRSDNYRSLQVHNATYTPITHSDMGAVASDLIAVARKQGGLKIREAGEIEKGARVFFAFELGDPYAIPGDPQEFARYMTMFTSHVGTNAFHCIQNDVRYGCANAVNSAAAEIKGGMSPGFSVRHTTNADKRLEEAKAGLANVMLASIETREMLTQLTKIPFREEEFATLTKRYIPRPSQVVKDSARWHKIERQRATLKSLFSDANPNLTGVGSTGYRAFNAIVEFEDHFANYRQPGKKVSATLEGGNQKTKAVARHLIEEIAKDRPERVLTAVG